ncbi:MAG: hypothetical protein ACRBBT_09365 [Paracoccaceae bacterium]
MTWAASCVARVLAALGRTVARLRNTGRATISEAPFALVAGFRPVIATSGILR